MRKIKCNLAKQKFPHFTVLEPVHIEYKNKNALRWKCLCECGNIFYTQTSAITSQKIKSCGCYQKKYQKEKHLGKGCVKIGDKFGLLKVIGTEIGKDGRTQYICKCKCGNIITLPVSHLKKRYSCGCLTEEYIPNSNVKAESLVHLGKKTARNTSGCPGVSWRGDKQKWQARIYFNGVNHHLGYFATKDSAIKARQEAENDIYNRYSDIIEEMPNKNNAFSKK